MTKKKKDIITVEDHGKILATSQKTKKENKVAGRQEAEESGRDSLRDENIRGAEWTGERGLGQGEERKG